MARIDRNAFHWQHLGLIQTRTPLEVTGKWTLGGAQEEGEGEEGVRRAEGAQAGHLGAPQLIDDLAPLLGAPARRAQGIFVICSHTLANR